MATSPIPRRRPIVFYCWQSDLPNATNRGLIETALEDAAAAIKADGMMAIDAVIDRDTAGVPGTPDIANVIFEKIRLADAVVCDISIVEPASAQQKRAFPNSNVMIEAGFALSELGDERVILVLNEAFGGISELPFDLGKKRVLTYKSAEADATRAPQRKELSRKFEVALRSVLATQRSSARAPWRRFTESGLAFVLGAILCLLATRVPAFSSPAAPHRAELSRTPTPQASTDAHARRVLASLELTRPFIQPFLIVDSVEPSTFTYHLELVNEGDRAATSVSFDIVLPDSKTAIPGEVDAAALAPAGQPVSITEERRLIRSDAPQTFVVDVSSTASSEGLLVKFNSSFTFQLHGKDIKPGKVEVAWGSHGGPTIEYERSLSANSNCDEWISSIEAAIRAAAKGGGNGVDLEQSTPADLACAAEAVAQGRIRRIPGFPNTFTTP